LRGPVNQAVRIASFAEFQRIFGGLWQPSTLSYAVEQFFDNGGRLASVVRVVNRGSPPTLSLRAAPDSSADGTLTLQAISPGSREFLRASVDYDNLGDNEEDRFNLVLQRMRTPGSERIEDQEIFRAVSIVPGASRFVGTMLLESNLARVAGKLPAVRPEATFKRASGHASGYVASNPDGDDGDLLSDYDLIGSSSLHTGMFALRDVEGLGFLYVPPLSREAEVGASTLVVAARFCRDKGLTLIVDPPADWQNVEDAIRGIRELDFHTDYATMFFPRIRVLDRLRARSEIFGNGGAVAGMLARADEQRPLWSMRTPEPELFLRAGARPATTLSERDRWRLANNGINALAFLRSPAPIKLVPRTLAGGANAAADWAYLPARRFASWVVSSIERGTRWVAQEHVHRSMWKRVTRQVGVFLRELQEDGAFPEGAEEPFVVVCDERVNSEQDLQSGTINILVGLGTLRGDEHHGFLISHCAAHALSQGGAQGSIEGTVKPVVINRFGLLSRTGS